MPSHSQPSLKAGLTALKQGDYQTAKVILEEIVATASDRTVVLQAEIGLVVLHARIGEVAKAIALCEPLVQNERPQVKEWAETTLQQLQKRYQKTVSSNTDETGFVAFEEKQSIVHREQEITENREKGNVETQENQNQENADSQKQEQDEEAKPLVLASPPPPPPIPVSSPSPVPAPSNSSAIVKRETIKPSPIYWRQAGRAKVWQPLPKRGLMLLRLLEVGTFVALFWMFRALWVWLATFINHILVKLPFLQPIGLLYRNPTIFLLVLFSVLICLSPWLLDWWLAEFYEQKQLDKETLNRHSKEAVRVLQRYCQQRGWKIPKLRVLPIAAPIAFSYGHLFRSARIVVSRGLLEQLAEDEIATIYASQLGQITHGDSTIMSLVLLVTLPIYLLYQKLAKWGDVSYQKIWRGVFGVLSSLIYVVWCLLVGTALWLSKVRLYYSDRVACETTGNPNALVRALLKIAIGIANDVQKQEHTSWQLESLNIVIPVGYKQSLHIGSFAPYTTFESLLMWDCLNPHRQWLTINNTHPLIGDRAQRLCKIARYWHVIPELYLDSQQPVKVKRQAFLLQIAPFLGIPLGIVSAFLMWLIWQTAFALKLLNLKWIYDDWRFVTGCIVIGFSVGILLRMNSFFRDIKPATAQTDENLPNLLTDPAGLPIDSIGVRLGGKLLGRQATSNYLCQDFILESPTGLIKLHHISWLGQSVNVQDLIGRQITVTGWWRRGATPWIDIQTLQTQGGKSINSIHPIWSIVVAVIAEVWGAYILLMG